MGIFRKITSWLRSDTAPQQAVRVMARPINARYDAAVGDEFNKNHWNNADSLSAKQANSPAVRERLRNHSRYEVANNCYARGLCNTVADIVIGYGPTLTIKRKPDASEQERKAAAEVSRLFNEWAEEIDLWGKLWTMRVSKLQDGEAFALFRTNPRLQSPVTLDLQLIEAEQVADGPYTSSVYDPRKVDGIETDDMGNPTIYKVLPDHPGDQVWSGDPIEVHHSQVIHWFRCDRPGQLRGIPEITPAIPLFAQLRRFTLATLTAAETAADFAAILSGGIADEDETLPAWDQVPIQRGTMTTTPEGMELSQFKAEHPTTTYEMFKREILCEVGRCLNMPKLYVLLDASGYNYSSGRLDKQATDRSIDVERYQCELKVLRKIFDAWLSEALLIPGYLPVEVEAGMEVKPKWMWRELGHVDRKKEADGAAQDLTNGTTTLAIECARVGEDWEEVLEQQAAERRRKLELGLISEGMQNASNEQQAGDVSPSSSRQPVADGAS
jgi:lambda family phage portal protein